MTQEEWNIAIQELNRKLNEPSILFTEGHIEQCPLCGRSFLRAYACRPDCVYYEPVD